MGDRRWVVVAVLALVGLIPVGLCRAPTPPASPVPVEAPQARSLPVEVPEPTTPEDVHCSVDGAPQDPLSAEILELQQTPEGEVPRRHTVSISAGWVVFRPLSAENVGMLRVPGFREAGLAWIDGACLNAVELVEGPRPKVVVRVALPEWLDEDHVHVGLQLDDGGRNWSAPVVDGRVAFEARPGRGQFRILAEVGTAQGIVLEQDVEIPDAPEVPVELDLSALPPQGWVSESELELGPGEAVVWVDGQRPSGLRYGMLGRAGESAEVVIRGADGVERTIEVPRRSPDR